MGIQAIEAVVVIVAGVDVDGVRAVLEASGYHLALAVAPPACGTAAVKGLLDKGCPGHRRQVG